MPPGTELAGLLGRLERGLAQTLPPGIVVRTRVDAAVPSAAVDGTTLELLLERVALRCAADVGGRGSLWLAARSGAMTIGEPTRPGEPVRPRACVEIAGAPSRESTEAAPFQPAPTRRGEPGSAWSALQEAAKALGAHAERREEGRGTVRYTLYLPVAHPEGEADGNGRILLVEDDVLLRDLVSEALTRAKFTVHVARDGEEALRMLDALEVPPDLVVLDLVLPGARGGEIGPLLRARWPATRFLLTSGYPPDPSGFLGSAGGAASFLQKPFHLSELVAKVRELLEQA